MRQHSVKYSHVIYRSLYDSIHMSCITISIMIATFTPVVADLPLLPSSGKFNPALGHIYPRATFTPAWCIRGMSFFKFTPAIPLGFVKTSGWRIRPLGHLTSCPDHNSRFTVNYMNIAGILLKYNIFLNT